MVQVTLVFGILGSGVADTITWATRIIQRRLPDLRVLQLLGSIYGPITALRGEAKDVKNIAWKIPDFKVR